jgi:hypothetical protein
MPKSTMRREVAPALPKFLRYGALLDRLNEKDRGACTRQAQVIADKFGHQHEIVWKRLLCAMATLSPHALRIVAPHGIQFFVPDGKYRMQVYALHVQPAGTIAAYIPDVLKRAISSGILVRTPGVSHALKIRGSAQTLVIDPLDSNTPDADPVFSNMTGWNRTAIRVTLTGDADESQLSATEQLCALAANAWSTPEPASEVA